MVQLSKNLSEDMGQIKILKNGIFKFVLLKSYSPNGSGENVSVSLFLIDGLNKPETLIY